MGLSAKKDLKRFFEILDQTEESANGVEFHPVQLSSCRVMLTEELENILKRLKEFVNEIPSNT